MKSVRQEGKEKSDPPGIKKYAGPSESGENTPPPSAISGNQDTQNTQSSSESVQGGVENQTPVPTPPVQNDIPPETAQEALTEEDEYQIAWETAMFLEELPPGWPEF